MNFFFATYLHVFSFTFAPVTNKTIDMKQYRNEIFSFLMLMAGTDVMVCTALCQSCLVSGGSRAGWPSCHGGSMGAFDEERVF